MERTPPAPPGAAKKRNILYTLSAGHMTVDLNAGAVAALLPLLEGPFHLSVGALTLLVTVVESMSSIVQPLFGILVDRRARPWVMPVGIIVATVGMSAVGFMPSYGLIIAVCTVMAVGDAMYHPEGSRSAFLAGGSQRASAMSIFAVGGNIGFAAGPLLLAAVSALAGLRGTLVFLVPGVVVLILFLVTKPTQVLRDQPVRSAGAAFGRTDRWAVFFVIAFVSVRSTVMFGVASLVPLYLEGQYRLDPHLASATDFVFLMAGAIGTLLGGPFSDRRGRRFHLLLASALATPVAFLMPRIGFAGFLIALAVLGFILVSTFSTTITLTQELMPGSVGTASGLSIGLGIGVGALAVLLLGNLSDVIGIGPVLAWLFVLPLLSLLVALLVRPPRGAQSA